MLCAIALYKNRKTKYKVIDCETADETQCLKKTQGGRKLREMKINVADSSESEELDIKNIPRYQRTFSLQERKDRRRFPVKKINISDSTESEELDIKCIPIRRRTFSLQESQYRRRFHVSNENKYF